MLKLFYNFALLCMLGAVTYHPTTNLTVETAKEQNVQSNQNEKEKDKRYEFQEKIKQAKEQWNKLTEKQKEEVYALLANELQAENNLTDKLVDLSVISNEDAKLIKDMRMAEFNHLKEKGEFPFRWHKVKKQQ